MAERVAEVSNSQSNRLRSWHKVAAPLLALALFSGCSVWPSSSATSKPVEAATTTTSLEVPPSTTTTTMLVHPSTASTTRRAPTTTRPTVKSVTTTTTEAATTPTTSLLPATVRAIIPTVISHGSGLRPEVALTFDDGPSKNTQALVNLLAQNGVHATFCMIGNQMARNPEAVKAIVAAGDDLCDHTQTHPGGPPPKPTTASLAVTDPARFTQEITQPAETMFDLTGQWPAFFRPPGGFDTYAGKNQLEKPLAALGMKEVLWVDDSLDWSNHSDVIACDRVIHGATGAHPTPAAKAGSIELSHDRDDVPILVEAQCIINGLKAKGLKPVSVSELLAS